MVSVTHVPDSKSAADSFLQAWKNEDYASMYGLLTDASQGAISESDFEKRYRDVAVSLTLTTLDFQVLSYVTNPASAQATYQVTFHTILFGDITPDHMLMNLSLKKGDWQVQWDDGMIMPALKGGNKLRVDLTPQERGSIYDSNGQLLAGNADAYALYVTPGQLDPKQEGTLLSILSKLTGLDRYTIKNMYKNAGPDWWVAIGEAPAAAVETQMSVIQGLKGLGWQKYSARYYANEGIASQTIGYVRPIFQEDLEKYQRQGYAIGQKVGASGLELSAEKYLAGTDDASLYVVDPKGAILPPRLAHADPTPAQSITTTLDADLQLKLQKSMGNFAGAIVVMERDTGKVLAMVSTPGFDPNLFVGENPNYGHQNYASSGSELVDRANQGVYPLGSVFKIVTMSAALQSGVYTAQSTYNCTADFTELEGVTLHDWTVEYGVPPSGLLTLPQGLMRSCDPYFWHIGLDLYNQGLTTAVSDMARAFGLGKVTGFSLGENPGNIPDPTGPFDAVNLAIGQGNMQVTPLQVADFVAAVGNGGTLYQPQMIEKIGPAAGDPTQIFAAKVNGTLPLSAENLKTLQDAMRSVINNPKGTAYSILGSLSIPAAGKTGTATTVDNPHAWFAGYTMANNPNKPDIAISVLVENAGEGSEMAAPIFRRVVSLYFSDDQNYGMLLPWESQPYIVASPTPAVTDTPTEAPTSPETETPTPSAVQKKLGVIMAARPL
jgi:penicillin-binding protein 2